MPDATMVLLFVLFGLGSLAFGVYRYLRNAKRIEALAQFCLSKGWEFSHQDYSLVARWDGEPFFQGRARKARNVVRGTLTRPQGGWPFVAFDYTYVTDSTDSQGRRHSKTHRFAICAAELPTWLPGLRVTPENVLTRIGNVVAGDDIELESEDFNRRFRVQSPDRKFACDVLPPRTMQMLLHRPPLAFRIQGKDLLCWEPGDTTAVELLPRLATLADFAAGIPDFVWHDYGSADIAPRNSPAPGGATQ